MRRLVFLIGFCLSSFATADGLSNLEIKDVMAGSSSGSQDSTWFRVEGLVGHENCQYSGQNVTLFYAKNDSPVSADKALSMLMAAKLTGKKVSIQYSNSGVLSDFWGFGITKCELHRIVLH